MEEELSADIIKATQLSLGKFVKRPPLTEKLLKKPPFRFLHDIISTVLKTTGFFEGLFEQEELISDNVKDRESKLQFLNKVITVLGFATGKTLAVKPSKIVAGQEPAKTNELLQCLGEALEKKLSSVEAVRKYLESINQTDSNNKKDKNNVKVIKKNHDVKKVLSKGDNKTDASEKDNKIVPKLKLRENTTVKIDSPPKKSQSTTNVKKNLVKNPQDQKTSPPKKTKREKPPNLNPIEVPIKIVEKNDSRINSGISEKNDNIAAVVKDEKLQSHKDEGKTNIEDRNDTKYAPENSVLEIAEPEKSDYQNKTDSLEKPKSLENNVVKEESVETNTEETKEIDINNKMDEIRNESVSSTFESNVFNSEKRPQSVRPSSSRPGAPRVKEKHDSELVGPENPVVHKVNIIVENTVTEEEEDGSIIIVGDQANSVFQNEEQMQLSSNQHGHLVQQILDSQKEFSQISGKTEIEWQFGAQKARDIVNQEIEQMRFNVQALSRISNPLGKLIDHIQEDVEVMRQELQEWIRKYEDTSRELLKQNITKSESMQPLQAKIKQLDADIEEKRDKINDLRIVVFRNFYRIEKLLSTSGNVQ